MGGGSAEVRAPHQVSIADGLTGATRRRDAWSTASRSGPGRAGRRSFRDAGPDVRRLRGAAVRRTSRQEAKTVGFMPDQELAEPVTRVVMSATVPGGAMRVGVLGVGTATVTVGDASYDVTLESESERHRRGLPAPARLADRRRCSTGRRELRRRRDPRRLGRVSGWSPSPLPRPTTRRSPPRWPRPRPADVAVVVVGLTEEQETEAFDKSTLALPGRQDELVSAVAAAARRTVVVVNAATPVLMPWRDEVDAILWAGLPGQEGGHAVAAALLGDIEPAGRLVTPVPRRRRRVAGVGRHPDRRAGWSTTRASSSATGATPRAARRRRRTGSATGSATASGSTARSRWSLAPAVGHRRAHQRLRPDVARGGAGLPGPGRGRPADPPGRLDHRRPSRPARRAASRSPATHARRAPGTRGPGARSRPGVCSSPAGWATSAARSRCRASRPRPGARRRLGAPGSSGSPGSPS